MTHDEIKRQAQGLMKGGMSDADIANKLKQSISLIEFWRSEMTPEQLDGQVLNALAVEKATQILKLGDIDPELLKMGLFGITLKISEMMKDGFNDAEVAASLNISARTVETLMKTWFPPQKVSADSANMSEDGVSAFSDDGMTG